MTATVVKLRGPSQRPRRPRYSDVRSREYLEPVEIERIRTAARRRGRYGHRDDTMVLVAYRHGLRASELVSLRWNQVDLDAAKLHVRRAKGGDNGAHPLSGQEIRALRRLNREQSPASPYVFTTERGGPATVSGFNKMLTRAAEAAGLAELKVHAHMLRHSAGYGLAERGHDLRLIQGYLGHRSVSSTSRYVALSSRRFEGVWGD